MVGRGGGTDDDKKTGLGELYEQQPPQRPRSAERASRKQGGWVESESLRELSRYVKKHTHTSRSTSSLHELTI
jgi:hypothetical protein